MLLKFRFVLLNIKFFNCNSTLMIRLRWLDLLRTLVYRTDQGGTDEGR